MDFLDVIHNDLPSLTGAGHGRMMVRRALRGIVKGHEIAVILASDGNIQRRVGRESSGMLLKTLDQIDALPSSLDVVNFTKLEELFTLQRMEGRGVEEDLGCRGRHGHHDRMTKARMNGCEKKLKWQKFNTGESTPTSRDLGATRVSRVYDRNDSEHPNVPRLKQKKSTENRINVAGEEGSGRGWIGDNREMAIVRMERTVVATTWTHNGRQNGESVWMWIALCASVYGWVHELGPR